MQLLVSYIVGGESLLSVKGTQYYQDDKPFFYLADTCWSAFTNITLEEWNYYLDYRASQGFNSVQINILSQWDASQSDLNMWPFPRKQNGIHYTYDYSQINPAYFDRAEKMLEMVRDHGMTPALVLLWSNYVPGTWASKMAVNNLFPFDELAAYVAYATRRFKPYNPIYFVSGDTDFPTEETIKYYAEVLRVAKENDPDALYSLHIKGRLAELPKQFYDQVDFFSYQSGHNLAGQSTAYTIPLQLRKEGFDRPIVDTEPCYEQISYSRNIYGRYSARDVRKASWSAVLSGANAGITYGAHGIWSWHRQGRKFGVVEGEGFDDPFDWRDALHFDGANDIAFLKHTVMTDFPNGIQAVRVQMKDSSIRVGVNPMQTRYAIYLPSNTRLDLAELHLNQDNSHARVIDLQTRQVRPLTIQSHWLQQSRAEADALVIIDKNKGE